MPVHVAGVATEAEEIEALRAGRHDARDPQPRAGARDRRGRGHPGGGAPERRRRGGVSDLRAVVEEVRALPYGRPASARSRGDAARGPRDLLDEAPAPRARARGALPAPTPGSCTGSHAGPRGGACAVRRPPRARRVALRADRVDRLGRARSSPMRTERVRRSRPRMPPWKDESRESATHAATRRRRPPPSAARPGRKPLPSALGDDRARIQPAGPRSARSATPLSAPSRGRRRAARPGGTPRAPACRPARPPGGPRRRRPDHENEFGESRSGESHVYQ